MLDIENKSDIRFFIYYLVNGTLDFDLLNNELKTNYIEYIEAHPELFFHTCCVFINHQKRTPSNEPMSRRCAEYICKTIEPDNFSQFDNFEPWEINFDFNSNDFYDCFKDFSYRIAFEKIEKLESNKPYYKDLFSWGASYLEKAYSIWANNLEIENLVVLNQEYAIDRAVLFFLNREEELEEWERELPNKYYS
jgi:hypothetical protein